MGDDRMGDEETDRLRVFPPVLVDVDDHVGGRQGPQPVQSDIFDAPNLRYGSKSERGGCNRTYGPPAVRPGQGRRRVR